MAVLDLVLTAAWLATFLTTSALCTLLRSVVVPLSTRSTRLCSRASRTLGLSSQVASVAWLLVVQVRSTITITTHTTVLLSLLLVIV
jgi:hypothetical protein